MISHVHGIKLEFMCCCCFVVKHFQRVGTQLARYLDPIGVMKPECLSLDKPSCGEIRVHLWIYGRVGLTVE